MKHLPEVFADRVHEAHVRREDAPVGLLEPKPYRGRPRPKTALIAEACRRKYLERLEESRMTWTGTIYLEQCVEHPDYRIRTTYSHKGSCSAVFVGRKIICYCNSSDGSSSDKAKKVAAEHLGGKQ